MTPGRQTLHQSGALLRGVLDHDIPPSVSKEAVEGRRLFELRNGISNLDDAAVAPAEQLDLIATGIFKEKPVPTRAPSVNSKLRKQFI